MAKRYKDVLDNVIVEFDATTESDLALARRYASMSVFAEAEEARMARGEPHDAERLIRASNAQRRIRAALQASHKQRKRASKRNAP